MIADACVWDHPGADRYTGTASAAISAYTEIPSPTRAKLIAAWERRDFSDIIFITRAGIHGKSADYERRINRMHFGSRGRICDSVSIDGWADSHVETAIVVCADGWCLAAPTVCSNWFILGPRIDEATPAPVPVPAVPAPAGPPELVSLTPFEQPTDLGIPTFEQGGGYSGFGGGGGYGGGGGGGSPPCAACQPAPYCPPASPVPEPHEWALLAAGLALLGWKGVRRAK